MVKRRGSRPKVSFFYPTPDFFKVYLPDQNSHRLCIPPEFIKQFNGAIPDKVILKALGGKLWHVDMEEYKGGIFFTNGWQAFAKGNSLDVGEFLVFRYSGSSLFTVRIFARNGCKKEDDLDIEMIATHVKVEEESETEEICQNHSIRKRTYSKNALKTHVKKSKGNKERSIKPIIPRSSVSRVEVGTKEDTAFKAASKFMSNSKYPSVICVVRPTYMQHRYLNIPARFVSVNIKSDTKTVKLQVSNKSWPVNLSTKRNRLCGGWPIFVSENSLKVGDICLFELINREDAVLKVSIYKSTN